MTIFFEEVKSHNSH